MGGIEDLKIFPTKENIKFIGTIVSKDNSVGICIGNYPILRKKIRYTSMKNIQKYEKNWVFVNLKNKIYIIYSWFPLQICQQKKNKLILVEKKSMPLYFQDARGS